MVSHCCFGSVTASVALFSDKVEQVTTERTADEVAAEIKRRLAVASESEQDGEPLH